MKIFNKINSKIVSKIKSSIISIIDDLPPFINDLLVLLKGNSSDTHKIDTHIDPYFENFKMKDSHCISLNGVDEYGTLSSAVTLVGDFEVCSCMHVSGDFVDYTVVGQDSSNHIKFRDADRVYVAIGGTTYVNMAVSPAPPSTPFDFKFTRAGAIGKVFVDDVEVGSATVPTDNFVFDKVGLAISGQYFNGQLFNQRFKDGTQDIHFRVAEGPGNGTNLISYSDNYETDGLYITWTGSLATMWAQRQDTYHGNSVLGYGYGENRLKWSEDFSNAIWFAEGSAVKTPSGIECEIDFNGTSSGNRLVQFNYPNNIAVGQSYTYLIDIKSSIQNNECQIIVVQGTDYLATSALCELTAEYQRFEVTHTVTNASSANLLLRVASNSNNLGPITIRYPQLTQDSGQYIKTEGTVLYYGSEYLPFLNDNKGGTFNNSESSMGPVEFPVGTPNGTDNTITMLADHGAIASHGTLDTSVPNYTHPTIALTAGIIRDVLFSDGTFMQLREGSGTNLYDQNDVLVGTLNGDPAFWDGEHMVSEEMILAEAVQGQNVFTDGFGHALYMTQEGWSELGPESIENPEFIYWTDPTVPDGWDIGGNDINNYVEEAIDGGIRIISDGSSYVYIQQHSGLTGKTCELNVYVSEVVSAGVKLGDGGSQIAVLTSVGLHKITHTFINDNILLSRVSGGSDATISAISIREANQIINKNKQFYLTNCGGFANLLIYNRVLNTIEDLEVKVFGCLAEAVTLDNVQLVFNGLDIYKEN